MAKRKPRAKLRKAAPREKPTAASKAEGGSAPRVRTGIPGLDDLIEGGFPRNGLFMLSGKCGTGKTTFGLQYLKYGAEKEGENGIFVVLEKEPQETIDAASRYGWNIEGLVRDGKLSVIRPDMHKFDSFKKTLEEEVYRIGAKRLVIDSFSLISAYFHDDPYDVRKSLVDLARMLRRLGCTAIVVEDIQENSNLLSYNGFKEFVVDGVLVVDLIKKDPSTYARTVFVRKMINTAHSLKLVPMEITAEGIEVYGDAEVF